MQACKLFINIVNKNKILILIYFVIFMGITLMLTSSDSMTIPTIDKVNTYLVFEDEEDSELVEFLDDYIIRVDVEGKDKIDDALFWDNIDLYISVPADYKEKIFNNEEEILTIKSTPDSIYAYQVINKLNEYFNYAKAGVSLKLCEKADAFAYASNKIALASSDITLAYQDEGNSSQVSAYNIITYVIASLILSIIGVVTLDLRKSDVVRRLNVSPVKSRNRNLTLILCYFVFAIIIVIACTLLTFVTLQGAAFTNIGYYFINNVIYAAVIVTMSYFLSSLCKNNTMFNCVSVVLPLVCAFLSGAFIPQQFMPSFTKIIAHFIPTYYTICGNNYINVNSGFNFFDYFKEIWPLLIFAGVFILGTLAVTKIQSRKEN